MDVGAWWAAVHGVAKSRTWLSNFTFTFYFPALEKEMITHSSVLAWRIPGTREPGELPSTGSHRVGHDWSDLAAAVISFDFPSTFSSNIMFLQTIMYIKDGPLQFQTNWRVLCSQHYLLSTTSLIGQIRNLQNQGCPPLEEGESEYIFLRTIPRTSLVVQWLTHCTLSAGSPGSIPGQGTRSHMLQLRLSTAKKREPSHIILLNQI